VSDFEGHIDFDLRDVIRDLQAKVGRVPDGHVDKAVLELVQAQSASSQPFATKKSR
jgi:hypothetical protein